MRQPSKLCRKTATLRPFRHAVTSPFSLQFPAVTIIQLAHPLGCRYNAVNLRQFGLLMTGTTKLACLTALIASAGLAAFSVCTQSQSAATDPAITAVDTPTQQIADPESTAPTQEPAPSTEPAPAPAAPATETPKVQRPPADRSPTRPG